MFAKRSYIAPLELSLVVGAIPSASVICLAVICAEPRPGRRILEGENIYEKARSKVQRGGVQRVSLNCR